MEKNVWWRRPRVVTAAMLLAGILLFMLRKPAIFVDPLSIPLFAEDGVIFFKQAFEQGAGAIFHPYSGQILLYQRLVAFVASPFPVLIQPAMYAAAAIAAAVVSCSFALSTRWRFNVPVSMRFALMIALLCSPVADESYGALLNAHWWLAIGLLLVAMLHDPISRRLKAGEIAFTALTALSGFAALYAVPALGVRALRERSRHSATLLGVALACVAVQGIVLLESARRGNIAKMWSEPATELVILARRVFGTAALGDSNLASAWPGHIPAFWVWVVLGALLLALASVWIRAPRLEIGALALALIGGWLLALWSFTAPGLHFSMFFQGSGASRYFMAPVAALYMSLVLWRPVGRVRLAAAGAACLILAFGMLGDFRLHATKTTNWQGFADCVQRAAGPCSVIIPPGWELTVDPRGR